MKKLMLTLLSAALIAGSTFLLIGAGKPATDAPATVTIGDIDAVSGIPYRIGSDSLGSYKNGVNSVSSIIQAFGDWELDAKASPLRKVRFDFGDPVPNSGANAPFAAAMVSTRFISKCASWGYFMPGFAAGQTVNCPLAVSIDYNGVTYALRANENYAGTQPIQWTCLARNATKCVSFEGIPSVVQADGQRKIVMQLLKPATKPRESDQLLGLYYMSFKVNVTTP